MRKILMLVMALVLIGCAASRTAYYDANTKAAEASALAVKAKFDAMAAAAAKCTTEGCAGMAMMGIAMTQTPEARPVQQYAEPGLRLLAFGERIIGLGANVYSQEIQADALIGLAGVVADSAGDRSVRIDQSNHSVTDNSISGSYNDSSDNSTTGDTISDSGNTTISDSYNTPTEIDVSGDGSVVGDGNVIDNSTVIDDHSGAGDCDGGGDCLPQEPIGP